jgi:murein DD-endopeptidase MepM/ murein hydrolase activator NlpD
MTVLRTCCLISALIVTGALPARSDFALDIDCSLTPQKFAAGLTSPVLPVEAGLWRVTNPFGNVVDCVDVPGLSCSNPWHHTGEDYLVNGRSLDSQNQEIYAVDNGVVVFSTNGNSNPQEGRAGLVLIKHVAPPETRFELPAYREVLVYKDGRQVTVSYEREFTQEIVSYYLHLGDVYVKRGDLISRGQVIGRTYTNTEKVQNNYTYPPHLHFEIWRKCIANDRNGYEPFGVIDFQEAVKDQIVLPRSIISANQPEREIARLLPSLLPTSGSVRLVGAEFGKVPGRVQLTGNYLFAGAPQTWEINLQEWQDTEIRFNLLQSPLVSRAFLIEPIRVVVSRSDGQQEADFYYPFKDVEPDDWFSRSVTGLWKDGLAEGPSGLGRFLPQDPIKRSEFIKLVVRALCPSERNQCSSTVDAPKYSDISKEDWFYHYVLIAWNLDWLDHIHEQFRPNDPISRAEAAKILALAIDIPLQSPTASPYSDVQGIEWFAPYVLALTEAGVVRGYSDGRFLPSESITRAEAASLVNQVRPKSHD